MSRRCPYCSFTTPEGLSTEEATEELYKHLNKEHFRCSECNEVFDNKDYDDGPDWAYLVCHECREREEE